MSNLMSFLSEFASYLMVFIIFIVVSVIGVKIGITCRKKKDAKTALEADAAVDTK